MSLVSIWIGDHLEIPGTVRLDMQVVWWIPAQNKKFERWVLIPVELDSLTCKYNWERCEISSLPVRGLNSKVDCHMYHYQHVSGQHSRIMAHLSSWYDTTIYRCSCWVTGFKTKTQPHHLPWWSRLVHEWQRWWDMSKAYV